MGKNNKLIAHIIKSPFWYSKLFNLQELYGEFSNLSDLENKINDEYGLSTCLLMKDMGKDDGSYYVYSYNDKPICIIDFKKT
jgi:hypothetical protein